MTYRTLRLIIILGFHHSDKGTYHEIKMTEMNEMTEMEPV